MTYTWDTSIRYVKTIGPTRSRELTKIGINTVGDLLEYPPLSYIYPGVTPISEAKEGMVVVKARIKHIGLSYDSVMEGTLIDNTSICGVKWYNARYVYDQLREDMTATFYGKFKGGVLQQPKWCTHDGGMESVYGGQYGEAHHQTIRAALIEVFNGVELPRMYNGDSRVGTFKLFHFPPDSRLQRAAVQELKMDESICLQLALLERRKKQELVCGEVIWI